MLTRRRFLAAVPGAVAAATLPVAAQRRRTITGVWAGAVTATGAIVKVLAIAPDVPVRLVIPGDVSPGMEQVVTTDADGVATFALSGLQARTRYRYAISAADERALEGSFRTFADGPFSFRVVFASCASTGSTSPVFSAMRRLQPDLFIHMGDLHYENIRRNDAQRFRAAYRRVLASPAQSALLRAVPIAYTWDDHDYGRNNSDRTAPSRPAAHQAYRACAPHYPLADGPEVPIAQAFNIGRVRVLMTDSRSERSPVYAPESQRTMLGVEQLAWLERELESSRDAPLVVLVNTVPWITKNNERTEEGWARYARERQHIADVIVRNRLTSKLVMLSGDAHMLALDDGTNSQYSMLPDAPAMGFVIAHAAPMDRYPRKKGGPYTHAEQTQNGQFGVMDVFDEGGPVRVRLQGMRGDVKVPGMNLELTAST